MPHLVVEVQSSLVMLVLMTDFKHLVSMLLNINRSNKICSNSSNNNSNINNKNNKLMTNKQLAQRPQSRFTHLPVEKVVSSFEEVLVRKNRLLFFQRYKILIINIFCTLVCLLLKLISMRQWSFRWGWPRWRLLN